MPHVPNQDRSVELLLRLADKPLDNSGAGAAKGEPLSLRKQAAALDTTGVTGQTGASSDLRDLAMRPGAAGADRSLPSADAADVGRTPDAAGRPFDAAMPGSPSSSEGRSNALLNHPAIRFIRENRALTMGFCAAVLVGVWWVTRAPSRRRRG